MKYSSHYPHSTSLPCSLLSSNGTFHGTPYSERIILVILCEVTPDCSIHPLDLNFLSISLELHGSQIRLLFENPGIIVLFFMRDGTTVSLLCNIGTIPLHSHPIF